MVLGNFPVTSKLPILSKLFEQVVFNQHTLYLDYACLFEPFQSGFQSLLSTECAHLSILNIFITLDSGLDALLFLELSGAFDTMEHPILLAQLNQLISIQGTAIDWFASYLQYLIKVLMLG